MGVQKENAEGTDSEGIRSAAVTSRFQNLWVTGSSKQRLNTDLELSPKFTGQSDSGTIPPLRIMAASPTLPRALKFDTNQVWRHQGFHIQIRYLSTS